MSESNDDKIQCVLCEKFFDLNDMPEPVDGGQKQPEYCNDCMNFMDSERQADRLYARAEAGFPDA